MKKIALFLILCIAHVAATDAQNTLFLETPNAPTGNTVNLVRTYKANDSYVSYHEPGNVNVFLLFNQGSFCRSAKLPQGLIIRDFQILNDTLFFCGLKGKNGVFGYMPMPAFYMPTDTIWYDTVPYINPGYLTKIEVYTDPSDDHTVAVMRGNTLTPSGITQSTYLIIAKIDGTYVDYYPYTQQQIEITGFDVTDNYIVASAVDISNSEIYLGKIQKSNLCLINYIRFNDFMLNTGVGIQHLKSDDITLNITVYDVPNNQFMSRIYTVDMTNFTNLQTQDVLIPQKSFPDEMVYLDSLNMLLMLQRSNEITNNHSYVYYLNPYNNSYIAKMEYVLDDYCNSIDKNGNHHYVAVEKPLSEHHYFYTRNVIASPSHCLLYDNTKVMPGPKFNSSLNQTNTNQKNANFKHDIIYTSSEAILEGCND